MSKHASKHASKHSQSRTHDDDDDAVVVDDDEDAVYIDDGDDDLVESYVQTVSVPICIHIFDNMTFFKIEH